MIDLPTLTAAIAAATSGVALIDQIADQIDRLFRKHSEPETPHEHSFKIKQEGNAIVSTYQGREIQRITAEDLKKLPESDLRHIEVLERSMENHYSIWAAVYPQLALASEPIAKAKTEQQLKGIVRNMKADLEGILAFLERSGLDLMDHYNNIRDVVGRA